MSEYVRAKLMRLKSMKKGNFHTTDIIRWIFSICLLIAIVAVFFYLGYYHEPLTLLKSYLEGTVNPLFFLLLMFVLPVLGVPISLFLLLAGMKFGLAGGITLAAFSMFFHMAVTYGLAHQFLRDWITRQLKHFRLAIPSFKGGRKYRHAFIFMLVPGLPYVMKNNVLALTGIGFGPYILINWTAQFGTSLPLILIGKGIIELNPMILAFALGLLSACYLLHYYLRKKYKSLSGKNSG
jgi:uncharacterized membrane protein YdjX (TVP38/TMEM64 family)